MKKVVFALLFVCLFLCACAPTEDIVSDANIDSSSQLSGDVSVVSEVAHVSVNSQSAPVLLLPCHTKDNLPIEFITAMQNNPIDINFDIAIKTEEDIAVSDLCQSYALLWQSEINRTVADLAGEWGEQYAEVLLAYAESVLATGLQIVLTDEACFMNIDEDVYLGTALHNGLAEERLNVYRQTAFRLKYILYLTETANGGKAEASLRFVHNAVGESKELTVITADENFWVCTPYSPSYTTSDGQVFLDAMQANPVDSAGEATGQSFQREITFSISQFESVSTDVAQEYSEIANLYMEAVSADAELFSLLYELGYMTLDMHNEIEVAGYRQVLFTLKYRLFVFETETNVTSAQFSVFFAES